MIIVRTPLRIPLGGGGTDLPFYYTQHGGSLISAAINKYIYIIIEKREFHKDLLLKYSKTEQVKKEPEPVKTEIKKPVVPKKPDKPVKPKKPPKKKKKKK